MGCRHVGGLLVRADDEVDVSAVKKKANGTSSSLLGGEAVFVWCRCSNSS